MKRTEWWVEYNFVETRWGRRALNIRVFHNEHDAAEFAGMTADGKILEVTVTTK